MRQYSKFEIVDDSATSGTMYYRADEVDKEREKMLLEVGRLRAEVAALSQSRRHIIRSIKHMIEVEEM